MIRINLAKRERKSFVPDLRFGNLKERVSGINRDTVLTISVGVAMVALVSAEIFVIFRQQTRISEIEGEVKQLESRVKLLKKKAKEVDRQVNSIKMEINKLKSELQFIDVFGKFVETSSVERKEFYRTISYITSEVNKRSLLNLNSFAQEKIGNSFVISISLNSFSEKILYSFMSQLQKKFKYTIMSPTSSGDRNRTGGRRNNRYIVSLDTTINPYGIKIYKADIKIAKTINKERGPQ